MPRRKQSAKLVGGGTRGAGRAGPGPGSGKAVKGKGKKAPGKASGIKKRYWASKRTYHQQPRRARGRKRKASPEGALAEQLQWLGLKPPSAGVLQRALAETDLTPAELVDEIAMSLGGRKKIRKLVDEKWLVDRSREIENWKRGLILVQSGRRLAVVCPTHASLADGGGPIAGAFTRTGRHWTRLLSRIEEQGDDSGPRSKPGAADLERAGDESQASEMDVFESGGVAAESIISSSRTGRQDSERTLVLDLESRVAAKGLATAIEASRRLREERTLALPVPATIETNNFVIRFDPIGSEGRVPIVPFDYRDREGPGVSGAIYLASPEDPLPIGVGEGPEAMWGKVMVIVLKAYADLTCLKGRLMGSSSGGAARSGREGRRPRVSTVLLGGSDDESSLSTTRMAPSRRSSSEWSSALSILGENPFRGSSLVVGHIRRLGEGRQASPGATSRAREVGITLRTGETWVSPHMRGESWTSELRFSWRDPPA